MHTPRQRSDQTTSPGATGGLFGHTFGEISTGAVGEFTGAIVDARVDANIDATSSLATSVGAIFMNDVDNENASRNEGESWGTS